MIKLLKRLFAFVIGFMMPFICVFLLILLFAGKPAWEIVNKGPIIGLSVPLLLFAVILGIGSLAYVDMIDKD